jgi:hypothetical protein
VKRIVAFAALLVAACGTGSVGGAATPSSSAGARPTPSPSYAAVACTLPIASGDAPVSGPNGPGKSGHGGFITMPTRSFAADLNSLGGYDHQRSIWLPVTYAGISPDGSGYAWVLAPGSPGTGPPGTSTVYINNLAGGANFGGRTPGPVRLVAWTATGIYLASINPQSDATPLGLSVMRANGAFDHQITSTGYWPVVGERFAYGADVDPSDPHPPVPNTPGPAPGNRIEQLDLQSGTVTPVITVAGARVFPEGLDYTENLVMAADTPSGFTVKLMPSNVQIFSGPPLGSPAGASDPVSALGDSTGIWFTSTSGVIWHYATGDPAAHQVATTGLASPALAGPCF